MVDRRLGIRERFNLKWTPEPFSGCWLWTDSVYHGRGYPYFSFKGRDLKGHRVSWELHRGPIPKGMCVLHRCDVRSCVNPDHLFLGTVDDNNQDRTRKGRGERNQVRGERVGTAVLTESLVREIKASNESSRVIAKRLGISKHPILAIRNGEYWRHVT